YQPTVMPALQQLVSDPRTVHFENHFVGVPRTFPSWVEILTGEYCARSGIRHRFPRKTQRRELFTLPDQLRRHGYWSVVVSDFAGDIFPRFDAGFDEVLTPTLTLPTLVKAKVSENLPL